MSQTRYIIRVANTDLAGERQIGIALTKIRGVSIMFASAICHVAGINAAHKAGDLSEAEEARLNEVIKQPAKFGIPEWMLNRRKDPETGEDSHLIGSDVNFTRDNDIKRMRKLRSYKGLRHAEGLTVRGQRTKSNFRKNKKRGGSSKKVSRQRTDGPGDRK